MSAANLLSSKPPSLDEAFNHHKQIPLHVQADELPSATGPRTKPF